MWFERVLTGTISDLDTSTTPKCFGHVDTGVPKASALFNLTVCHPSHYDLYTSFKNQKHVETVDPVTIERVGSAGLDVIFLASNGEVTSVDGTGRLNWMAETVCVPGSAIIELLVYRYALGTRCTHQSQ